MSAWAWETTLAVAILCIGALVASRRPRYGAAVAHGLWLVALLKFLMPPVVAWPIPAAPDRASASIVAEAQPAAIAAAPPARKGAEASPAEIPPAAPAEATAGVAKAAPPPAATAAPTPRPAGRWGWWGASAAAAERYAPAAWGISAAAVGLWSLGRIVRFQRRVRRAEPAPSWLAGLVEEAASAMEVAPPQVAVATGLPSPLLWCWGRPIMLIPESWLESVPPARLRGAIGHELAHLARRDHWVAWLELVAGVVWWWHPLLHIVRRGLRETADASCDARVVAAWPEGRRDYAELLIDACRADTSGPSLSPALGLGGPGRAFERRLTMIMKPGPRPRLSRLGRLSLMALALAAFPAWSSGEPPRSTPRNPFARTNGARQGSSPFDLGQSSRNQRTDQERLEELDEKSQALAAEYQEQIQGLKRAESEIENAARKLEEIQPLFERKAISKQEYQEAEARAQQARDGYARAEAKIAPQKEALAKLNREMQSLQEKIAREEKERAELRTLQVEATKKLDAMEGNLQASLLAAEKAYQGKLKPPAVIEPGDILSVGVLEALPGRPIEGEYSVRGDGTIGLGFYGDVRVAGLNRVQIKEKLISHLRKYLSDEVLGLYGHSSDEGGKIELIKPADSDRVFIQEFYVKNDPATHARLEARQAEADQADGQGRADRPDAPAGAGLGVPAPPNPAVGKAAQPPQGETARIGGSFGGAADHLQIRVVQPDDAKSEDVWNGLDKIIQAPFKEPTPVKDVIAYVEQALAAPDGPKIEFYVDPSGLEDAGFTADDPVVLDLKQVRAKTALRLILRQLKLTYIIRDGLVIITTPESAATDFEIVPEGQLPGLEGVGHREGGLGGMF